MVLLTLATLLPVALFGAAICVLLVQRELATLRRGAEARTVAAMTASDAAVGSWIAALEGLAFARLGDADFGAFAGAAGRFLSTRPDWRRVVLSDAAGQVLAAAGTPRDASENHEESFLEAVRTQRPAVGNLVRGMADSAWRLAVRVPVLEGGSLKYVLGADVFPQSLSALLHAQRIPESWSGMLMDAGQRVVATSSPTKERVGEPVPSVFSEAVAGSAPGWLARGAAEGEPGYIAFTRSQLTGWVLAVGIPVRVVQGLEKRVTWILSLGGIGALGLALPAAMFISRRITGPIASLTHAARAVARGEHAEVPPAGGPEEIRALNAALRAAADAVRERDELVEREKAAMLKADRLKDEFVAVLGHELRNPLAALMAAAHVLKNSPAEDAAVIKARSVVDRLARQMSSLMEDLLDISRQRLGATALNLEVCRLDQLVEDFADSARALHVRPIKVTCEPVSVMADPVRVEQILSNLVQNAVKFSPRGTEIAIGVRREAGDAVLQVSDPGEGLTHEFAQLIFTPFVRGRKADNTSQAGVGLGLAVVKSLVEMHGGSVSAMSEGPGCGTVFTVRLPVTLAAAEASRRPAALAVVPAGRTILLVEDDDDTRDMLQAMLELSGYDVTAARDGATALALAAQAAPDVALVDIELPDMEGYELARRLRATTGAHRVKLCALSGHAWASARGAESAAGFDAHLTKPVSPERLERALSELAR
jgi:signal transduction histidine kinase